MNIAGTVPNALRDQINAALDLALKDWLEHTLRDRDVLYREVLAYFNDYGMVPDFSVVKAIPA